MSFRGLSPLRQGISLSGAGTAGGGGEKSQEVKLLGVAMIGRIRALLLEGSRYHRGRTVVLLSLLVGANLLLWGIALASFRGTPLLLGTAFLAFGFGLRHAMDADHIAAIDNVTRMLVSKGKRPVGVGFFFSLGHSTIVFGLSAVLAAAAAALKDRLPLIRAYGNIAGALISSAFLLAFGIINLLVLFALLETFRKVRAGGGYSDEDLTRLLSKRGIFGRLFRGIFGLIGHSWQMYYVGLLFGLGFDTATEIGILGISAAEGSGGLSVWSIMIFPALFAGGMTLVDTTENILMLGAYGWAFGSPVRKLYYNLAVTSASVLVALVIGGLEALGLVQREFHLTGGVWKAVSAVTRHFGSLGYVIFGLFVASWTISVAFYRLRRYDEVKTGLAESSLAD